MGASGSALLAALTMLSRCVSVSVCLCLCLCESLYLVVSALPPCLESRLDIQALIHTHSHRHTRISAQCLSSVAVALRHGFAVYGAAVFKRCVNLIEKTLQEEEV